MKTFHLLQAQRLPRSRPASLFAKLSGLILLPASLIWCAGGQSPDAGPDKAPQGLEASDWASIRAAHDSWQHAVQPQGDAPGRWQARNPGQQWTTEFDGRGFTTRAKGADWEWGLELGKFSVGSRRFSVGENGAKGAAEGNRLSFARGSHLTEWFVNDSRGLEQGWTLAERPTDGGEGPVRLELIVSGDLEPVVSDASVAFTDAAGALVLTYGGLKAWDADGRDLAAKFASSEGGIAVEVDEHGARYPITIDPIAQQAYLKASQVSAGDQFGFSVAVSGDTVVVGAPHEDSSTTGVNSTPNESATSAGAAYVFVRSGSTWTQQAYLKASQVSGSDEFGVSVAVSGDTVVVGAYGEDSSTTGVNSTPNESAESSGAGYVFVRSGTTWTQQAYLKASLVSGSDEFGRSVAVSGDTVVVGAYREDSSTTGVNSTPGGASNDPGAAYVFERSGTTWTQQAYLKASQVSEADYFGWSVAVNGDTVVVGAYGESSSTTGVNSTPNENRTSTGAAYVFVRSGTTWTQQAYLKASQVSAEDWFGYSVAVSGDTVVVGAPYEDSNTTGVNSTPNEAGYEIGAAYVFVRSGTTWTQQAYLKTSQVTEFGSSVAVSADTVVVGAPGEESGTAGVNSTPDNSASYYAGAAYVFVRSGATWTQQAYLKASQVSSYDWFGYSVAVSGDTVVVGAPYEDSSTTGVNSTPDDNSADTGAAYLFTGLGSAPEISVRGNGLIIADGDGSPTAVDHTDFGGTLVAGGTLMRTFTIENTGNAPLNLTGTPKIVLGGSHAADFTVTSQPATPVTVGNSVTFQITFDPSVTGLRSANLSIANDDPTQNPFTFAVQGTGVIDTPQQKFDNAVAAAGLTGSDALANATPHDDSIFNLLKYAFNLNLSTSDVRTLTPGTGTAGLPVITVPSPGVMRVEYVRRLGSGLVYTPRKSSNLASGSWTSLMATPVVTAIDADWERLHHDEPFDPATTPSMFGSVEVTLP